MIMDFRKEVEKIIKAELNIDNFTLEVPPDQKMGDFAFPCFILAKEFKKSPVEIAKELSTKFKPNKYVSEIKNIGPYVNF